MKQINLINSEIDKVNAIIEDCYSYLKKATTKNQERIKSLLERALNLRNHYLSKLRRVAAPDVSADVSDNIKFQVYENYSRVIGF